MFTSLLNVIINVVHIEIQVLREKAIKIRYGKLITTAYGKINISLRPDSFQVLGQPDNFWPSPFELVQINWQADLGLEKLYTGPGRYFIQQPIGH